MISYYSRFTRLLYNTLNTVINRPKLVTCELRTAHSQKRIRCLKKLYKEKHAVKITHKVQCIPLQPITCKVHKGAFTDWKLITLTFKR